MSGVLAVQFVETATIEQPLLPQATNRCWLLLTAKCLVQSKSERAKLHGLAFGVGTFLLTSCSPLFTKRATGPRATPGCHTQARRPSAQPARAAARAHLQVHGEVPPAARHKQQLARAHDALHWPHFAGLGLGIKVLEPLDQRQRRRHLRAVGARVHACAPRIAGRRPLRCSQDALQIQQTAPESIRLTDTDILGGAAGRRRAPPHSVVLHHTEDHTPKQNAFLRNLFIASGHPHAGWDVLAVAKGMHRDLGAQANLAG